MVSLAAAWMKIYPNTNTTTMTSEQLELAADDLNVAMKGVGTDETSLIEILGKKSPTDRELIATMFQRKYKKRLITKIAFDVRLDFGRLLKLLVVPLVDAEVIMLRNAFDMTKTDGANYYGAFLASNMLFLGPSAGALAGIATVKWAGTRERHLFSIVLGRENSELQLLKDRYERRSLFSLTSKIKQETSGNYQEILLSCLEGNQETYDQSGVHTDQRVMEDVEKFHDATKKGKFRTDETAIIQILCNLPAQHLSTVNAKYEIKHGNTMATVIENQSSGYFGMAALHQLHMQIDPLSAIKMRFDQAMDGAGTDEYGLMNLVVRYQSHMGEIMALNPSLKDKIQKETSRNVGSDHFSELIMMLIDYKENAGDASRM